MIDIRELISIEKLASEYSDTFKISSYVSIIYKRLGYTPEHSNFIGLTASLVDIGKMTIPDDLLQKHKSVGYSNLTKQEQETFQHHSKNGYNILSSMESEFFKIAADISLFHHENWDGSGYPHNLKGETIPLAARITAVVVEFINQIEIYNKTDDQSRDYISSQAGKKFDPIVVQAFLSSYNEILKVEYYYSNKTPRVVEYPYLLEKYQDLRSNV